MDEMKAVKPHPMQSVYLDVRGIARFRPNKIIEDLQRRGVIDLNEIARGEYSPEDEMQLAQLIGYSVSGYGDLSYASRRSVNVADRRERLEDLVMDCKLWTLRKPKRSAVGLVTP